MVVLSTLSLFDSYFESYDTPQFYVALQMNEESITHKIFFWKTQDMHLNLPKTLLKNLSSFKYWANPLTTGPCFVEATFFFPMKLK